MIITRFAPSPTGFLHIGSARTALFNWLYAKHTGGKFLLRIEDTDQQRSTEEAIVAIIDGMKWLGLDWDGDYILQSTRTERHRDVALKMVENGNAYYCYSSPEEIQEFRQSNPHAKFESPWRDQTSVPTGVKPAVRLKANKHGKSLVKDAVQGDVYVENSQLDDMVILRSDGTPTYMLAVVVDDHDMGVNTVIRGDDHFTNTFRQEQIYTAMGWQSPNYCHIPLINGPDGKKLSKRHGAMGVGEYHKMGYLPEAISNYLLRLGWSHGDDEIIPLKQAIELFDLNGLGKSPSRFDFAKLDNVNAHYLRQMQTDQLLSMLKEKMVGLDETSWNKIKMGLPLLQERASTINNLASSAKIFINKIDPIDSKAQEALTKVGDSVLTEIYQGLSSLNEWNAGTISQYCKDLAEGLGLKTGVVMQVLRASVVGSLDGPGIADIMSILGKEATLTRMKT